MKQPIVTAFAAATIVGLAMSAAAQQPPKQAMGHGASQHSPGMMRGPGMTGGAMMPGMGPMMGEPGRHVEGRIAFLRTELGITPAQEKAWDAYAKALRSAAASMQAMHDQMMAGGMPTTLPERIQRHEQMMMARLEALRSLRTAAVPLYNALSPEQKKIADSLMM